MHKPEQYRDHDNHSSHRDNVLYKGLPLSHVRIIPKISGYLGIVKSRQSARTSNTDPAADGALERERVGIGDAGIGRKPERKPRNRCARTMQ